MGAGEIFLIVWAVGFLLAWRIMFRVIIADMSCGHVEWGDIGFALPLSAVFAAFGGPLLVIGVGIKSYFESKSDESAARFVRLVAGESRADKEKRRRRELQDARDRMHQLERELSIERGER